MISFILIDHRGLIGSILIIHIYTCSLNLSPEFQTHIPNYLMTSLIVPHQSLNSWFLLSHVFLYQCFLFCSTASQLTQCLHPRPKAFKILLWFPHLTPANPVCLTYNIHPQYYCHLDHCHPNQGHHCFHLDHCSGHLMPSWLSPGSYPHPQLFPTKQPEWSSETQFKFCHPSQAPPGAFHCTENLIMVHRDPLHVVFATSPYLFKLAFLSLFIYSVYSQN